MQSSLTLTLQLEQRRLAGWAQPSSVVLAVALVAASLSASVVKADEAEVSFNRDIRPILADRCFPCHGPDAAARQADLRFDREDVAKGVLAETGHRAIVPSDPSASEILQRLTDTDNRMPPEDSNLSVTPEEIERIRSWIAQGAVWERHWAFIPPKKSPLPEVAQTEWPRWEFDAFVLHRLEAEGLKPNPAADPERWLRRVTFDLTGLPPSIEEMDAFLADPSQVEREAAVKRLLSSPAFGERMALEWLDVARYGDTDGLFEDHPREMHPWRDWVVAAFNDNLPYDDFIRWQLAGDLLPEATVPQRVATGFLRNNPTSNEGGIIDEDYRIKYLIDRVNTTSTAFLGLTLECAQCHDHKFDPMTQREYYQFAAFFNSLEGRGNTKGAAAPTLKVYSQDALDRLEAIAAALKVIDETVAQTPQAFVTDFDAWLKEIEQPGTWTVPSGSAEGLKRDGDWYVSEAPTRTATTQLGKGRFVRVARPAGTTGFLTISEVEVYSKGRNVARTGRAKQSSVAYNSPASKAINGNNNGSFASCSCTASEKDAWWELDLGTTLPIEAIWVYNRTDCCPERLDNATVTILDESRATVFKKSLGQVGPRRGFPKGATVPKASTSDVVLNLEAAAGPVSALRLTSREPNVFEVVSVTVADPSAKDGKPMKVELVGELKRQVTEKPEVVAFKSAIDVSKGHVIRLTLRSPAIDGFSVALTGDDFVRVRASVPPDRDGRMEHYRRIWPGFAGDYKRQAELKKEKKSLDDAAPVTMIAADVAKARKTFILERGEYDKPGEQVQAAGPSSIMAWSEEMSGNRLGLAEWVVHPANPLTARVVVNRYWQMLFGTGLVRTSEDFGTQGEPPSHQDLLDWLAVDFVESGWDVKRLLTRLVLSSSYGQSSVQSLLIRRADPNNRLLSHMPRRRLPAEFIRDHALAVSGLLVRTVGGRGVNPYQPAELFGPNAIGASNAKFVQSQGDALYRRSLYTYWKRQIPAANMRILGADGRTKCRTRRESTNTPLQALVLMNDPQFVEAARALAKRVIEANVVSNDERIALAFRLVTSRRIHDVELEILRAELDDRLKSFAAEPERARKWLRVVGGKHPDDEQATVEWAAFAAVSALILNLDESISAS